ncbi:hypothetical protein MP638_006315 [Amoeboaphelidium occidentale]|nr:hypothetical protein MP638_006315 [Amoeboaphelidium occidentale]
MNWQELKQHIDGENYDKLQRSPEQESVYSEWRNKMKEQNIAIDVYLKKLMFPTHKLTSDEPLSVILRQNDFPYNLEEGILHYVLWANKELSKDQIERYLKFSFPKSQILWFRNPPTHQTVLSLWHIHVLVKFE